MFIDFISISADPDEYEDLEDFLMNLSDINPSVRRPISLSTQEIIRFEPSEFGDKWTDVFTLDGDILTADMEYIEFKTLFYTALDYSTKQTWEMLKSDDEEINIRFFKN